MVSSSDQNVKKLIFKTDNAIAEAVLYQYPTYEDRTVICISTQSGCPIGCRFCGSGDYFVRNLTTAEIISQAGHCLVETGVDPSDIDRLQIMFMSMGEPMLNLRALIPALETLCYQYPHAALLVSTSAPDVDYEPFMEVSQRINTIGLQFSVHESTDEARNRLIPFAKKLDLNHIVQTGEAWWRATGRKPFFNYCAHDGNTSPEDVQRLFELFEPGIWNATISVICERDETVAEANRRQFELANNFSRMLVEAGYDTRVFNPAGQDDIGGGCGQLFHVQNWMKENPELAKPSVGCGREIVHMPREILSEVELSSVE